MTAHSEDHPGENTKEFFEPGINNKDQIVDEYLNSQGLTKDDIGKFKAAKKQALDDSQMAEKARVTNAEIVALEAEIADPTSDPDQLFLMPEGMGENESHLCDDKKYSNCGDIDSI